MARPLRLAAATAFVLAAICACSASPNPTGGSAAGGASSPASATASGSSGGNGGGNGGGNAGGGGQPSPAGGAGGGGNAGGFAYTPWGPDDPPIPTQYATLAASPGRPPRCDDLAAASPGGPFWATALSVCHAVTGTGPWPGGVDVPPPPAAENAYQACLNSELGDMLSRALRWHASHPGVRPDVQYPASTSTSPCQYRIYGVDVLGPQNSDSGQVPQGEVPLAVLVGGIEDAPADAVVTVDGVATQDTSDYVVDPPGDGMVPLFVLTARPREAMTAIVTLHLRGRTTTSSVDLPGPEGPSSSPSTGPSSSPSSVPPASRSASTGTSSSESSTSSSANTSRSETTQPATGEPTS